MKLRLCRQRWLRLLLLLAFQGGSGFALSLSAQSLVGHVLDAERGAPVPGALVELIGGDGEEVGSRLADDQGRFVFSSLSPGVYRIRAEGLGYRTTVSGFVSLRAEETVELEFRMAVEAVLLEPLTVTASPRPWYQHVKAPALWEYYERSEYMKRLGRGRFLDREELRDLEGLPLSQAIATVPGMQVMASETGPNRFHVLGRRGCDALFFVDGMQVRLRAPTPISDAARRQSSDPEFVPGPQPLDWFIDDFVSLHEVEAIEVYRGPSELPGEFHGLSGNANCGAVVVWTKRDVEPVGRGGGGRPTGLG